MLGQWLEARAGLLNVSPVFALCVVGWARLAAQRDRRFVVVVVLHSATALVNGLHPEWTFGMCFPARSLLCAMPALLLGLARALQMLRRSLWGVLLFAALFALSADGVVTFLRLPELAYGRYFLLSRALVEYYPWGMHFTPSDSGHFAWWELAFWLPLGMAALVALSCGGRISRSTRLGALAIAACVPAIWGHTPEAASRVASAISPDAVYLTSSGSVELAVVSQRITLSMTGKYDSMTGEVTDEWVAARAGEHEPGLLASLRLGSLRPGELSVRLSRCELAATENVTQGYVVVALRPTLPAKSRCEDRYCLPLRVIGGQVQTEVRCVLSQPALGYVHVLYTGLGAISLRNVDMSVAPIRGASRSTEIHRLELGDQPGARTPIRLASKLEEIRPGRYRIHFDVRGGGLGTWLERDPEPVVMALYSAPVNSQSERRALRERAVAWFERSHRFPWSHPAAPPPQVESLRPPWWTRVPFAGGRAYDLEFVLAEKRDVWLLISYEGPEDLSVQEIGFYQLRDRDPQQSPASSRGE